MLEEEFLEKYRMVELKDEYTNTTDMIITLNKKHSVEEFQAEINRVRNLLYEAREKGEYDDDDWSFIVENISSKFDWLALETENKCLYY